MPVKNYFARKEIECPCCGLYCPDEEFLTYLNELREACGFPIFLNSFCRCEKHNREIGGSPRSAHLRGLAADIRIPDNYTRAVIIGNWTLIANKYNLPYRIEIGKHYIHIDIDRTKPQPIIWFAPGLKGD